VARREDEARQGATARQNELRRRDAQRVFADQALVLLEQLMLAWAAHLRRVDWYREQGDLSLVDFDEYETLRPNAMSINFISQRTERDDMARALGGLLRCDLEGGPWKPRGGHAGRVQGLREGRDGSPFPSERSGRGSSTANLSRVKAEARVSDRRLPVAFGADVVQPRA
jgi:hypothetical protein